MSRSSYLLLLPAVALLFGTGLLAQNPAAASAPDLSDPEVAHVAVTANSIDIDLAKLAQTRTHNAAVKQFAATMITDHSAVNAQAAALATKLGVTPADNAVSQSLQTGAKQARASLEPLRGAAFDRAYIDREVAFHQAELTVVVGDTVVWINRDIVPHTATGSGRTKWDTGQLLQGQAGRYVASSRGTKRYACTFHPTMHGTLIVR